MEQSDELASFLKESAEEVGVALNFDQINTFLSYLEQLKRWNKTISLTSIVQDREIIIKHFVDSLAGLKAEILTSASSLVDIGTGAGFPGLPLKIVRPDVSLTLVEPVKKKVSFLRFLIGLFHLEQIRIFEGTVDQFITDAAVQNSFDYVTTRALRYSEITEYIHKLLKKNGKAIFYLSESIDRRSLTSNLSIDHEYSFELPGKHGKRVISVLAVSN